MIRRWPVAGEMSIECGTQNKIGVHARCKATTQTCTCDCHKTWERVINHDTVLYDINRLLELGK